MAASGTWPENPATDAVHLVLGRASADEPYRVLHVFKGRTADDQGSW